MDLVDGHRAVQPVGVFALFHPSRVTPGIGIGPGDDGGGAGAQLELLTVRIGFQEDRAGGAAADFELVQIAWAYVGYEQLPYPAATAYPHRMNASVPAIETAYHTHSFGIGCPDREQDTSYSIYLMAVRA